MEPTVTGRKPGLKATTEQKEKINIQQEQNEEIRIQKSEESPGWCSSVDLAWTANQSVAQWKSEESLTILWDNLKCSNI